MSLSVLDERIFALDRHIQHVLTVGGQVIPMGRDAVGNTKSIDISFDIEQIPPTASIKFSKEQLTEDKSGIPTWVKTGMDVSIEAGYDGEIVRIFTGRVKKPRHGVNADTLDCVGRTGKLTRPYRVAPPKVFTATNARAAIIDILDDYGVDFTPAGGEHYFIDPILMRDGTPWIMATVVDAVMDMAPPSDMIRRIADVYGNRVYELPSGTLRIRELLEVPAPEGFRTYSTDASVGVGETLQSTLTFDDSNIDSVALMGNVAANTRRSQAFVAAASGSPSEVSVWARRVGVPLDGVVLSIYRDDGSGLPSTAADGLLATGPLDRPFNGQLLDLVTYTKMTILIPAAVQLISGDTYHIVISRSGALDAVNHYDIGADAPVVNLSFEANPDALPLPEDPWSGGSAGIRNMSIYITEDDATQHGNTNIGAEQLTVQVAQQDARKITLPAGTFDSITAYGLMTGGGPQDALFALYDDNAGVPGNLLAYTAEFVVGVAPAAWYTGNIAFNAAGGAITDITLGGGTYWISIHSHYGGGFVGDWFYDDQGFTGGAAAVFDGTTWSAEAADITFEIVSNSFATLRVLNIGDDEDEDQIKKLIFVKGAVIPDRDADGNDITRQVTATAGAGNDDLVAGLDELFAATYLSDLIDTDQVAGDVALRLIEKYHRVHQTIEIEVPFDPRMALGTTITIDDPAVTGHGGNWWVSAYRHSLSPDNAVTQLSLFGGDQSGSTGELHPQPDFDVVIERELIGNALMAIVTYTSISQDNDGWITNYSWLDNYAGGANSVSGEVTKVTFAYDPAVDPAIQMVLTVTDNDGHVVSSDPRTVDVATSNSEIYAPVVSCAGGNTCMTTFDGGMSWEDIVTPSGNAVVTAITYNPAKPQEEMVILFGTDNGRIYRSTDGMQTLVLEYTDADGDAITAIEPDTDRRGVLWATTTDRVLFSFDYGDTWRIYTDFNSPANWPKHGSGHVSPGPTDPRPINALAVSNASVNRIWIFGGVGDVVESWFATNWIPDGGGSWESGIAQGDGSGAVPRNALDTVVDYVVSHAHSGDLGLMFERTGGGVPPNPYLFASPFYPVGTAGWQVGGGSMVTPGVDGVSVASNNLQVEQFGAFLDNQNFYVANDGRSFWPIPNVLPGTGANRPNHLLNVTAWRDIYLGATDEGVIKSIDGGVTWNFFRPVGAPVSTVWPGGAIGWQVAIEYRRPRSYNLAVIVQDGAGLSENALAIRTSTGGWEDHGPLPTAHANEPHRLWHFPQISDQVLFFVRYVASGFGHGESLYRTPDQGATWTNLGVAPMLTTYAMARAGDGTLWASGDSHPPGTHFLGVPYAHEIFRSIDDGLSWEKVYEDTVDTADVRTTYKDVAIDPNNPDRIMFIGVHQGAGGSSVTLRSSDATEGLNSNWDRQITGLTFEASAAKHLTPFILAGDAERWIIGFQPQGVTRIRIYTNDQNGVPAAWDLRYDVVTSTSTFGFGDRLRAGNILYAIGTDISQGEGILRSINNGNSWEIVHNQTTVGAAIWDAQTDMLIVGRQFNTDRFVYYQPPTIGATPYFGIDVGLDAAMGYVATPAIQGMALLRTAGGGGAAPTELWAIAQLAAAGGDTDIWLRESISDDWRNYLDMADTVAGENRFPIWHFDGMGDVMFRLKIGDLGDAGSGYGGNLERSIDRGLNWTTVLANAGSLTRGRNGHLWATADDRGAPGSFQPRTIYRSRDGGIVWSPMGTDTTAGAGGVMTKYTQIRVDPNNANRIMAVGGLETDTMRSAYSSDAGATWDFESGSMSFRDGTAADGVFINLEAGGAGRWIIGLSQSDGLAKFIFVSDNFGETWIQKYTVVTTAVTLGWVGSVRTSIGNLYLAGNGGGASNGVDGRVVVSTNNGDTWAPFTGDDRTDIMAVTYDNNQSTLYIGRASVANNVLYMKNPSVLGIWSDDSISADPRFILQEALTVIA